MFTLKHLTDFYPCSIFPSFLENNKPSLVVSHQDASVAVAAEETTDASPTPSPRILRRLKSPSDDIPLPLGWKK